MHFGKKEIERERKWGQGEEGEEEYRARAS
jgi:hypothetical protein